MQGFDKKRRNLFEERRNHRSFQKSTHSNKAPKRLGQTHFNCCGKGLVFTHNLQQVQWKICSVIEKIHPSTATRSGDGLQRTVKLAGCYKSDKHSETRLTPCPKTCFSVTLYPTLVWSPSCFTFVPRKARAFVPALPRTYFDCISSLSPSKEEPQFTAVPHLLRVSHLAHVFPSQRLPSRLLAPDAAVLLLQICSKSHYYEKESNNCPSFFSSTLVWFGLVWFLLRFDGLLSLHRALRAQTLAIKLKVTRYTEHKDQEQTVIVQISSARFIDCSAHTRSSGAALLLGRIAHSNAGRMFICCPE
jgi:hypothetical protein